MQGKLLLQQRAASKITFPSVWTNTCCSHQLSGFDPPEVDLPEAVSNGSVMGSKRAAVRKLGHELGIPAHQVSYRNLPAGVKCPFREHAAELLELVPVVVWIHRCSACRLQSSSLLQP